jgi:transcriptional regulator with XRE-family HTH domain
MVKRLPAETPWKGSHLASLRKTAGLTQVALADAVGVTRRMVAYYEKESEHPPAAMLVRLAKVLRVSTDELLGVAADRKSHAPSRRWMCRLLEIERLSKMEQKVLLRMIDVYLSKKR